MKMMMVMKTKSSESQSSLSLFEVIGRICAIEPAKIVKNPCDPQIARA